MKTRVAYLGPAHTFTHLAAQKVFGARARYLALSTIDEIFTAVERRNADYGVVPVENSLEGAVTHTLDRFIEFWDSPARICGEIELPIKHCLIGRGTRADIAVVYSHPQALAQCRKWLAAHLPHVDQRETRSTAEALQHLLMKGREPHPLRERAALATRIAAERSGLRVIAEIPHEYRNMTRFVVVGLPETRLRGRPNKTSVLFAVKDRAGALYDALAPFKKNRINLTKIESRPAKAEAWNYFFFIDLEGSVDTPSVQRALQALARVCAQRKILGSYPRAAGRRSPRGR